MRPSLAFALSVALGAGAVLPGCTQFPQLDATISDTTRRAPYPDLVPLEGLRARIDGTRIAPDTAESVTTRADRLRARAARLRGPVIDAPTRVRMRKGVEG